MTVLFVILCSTMSSLADTYHDKPDPSAKGGITAVLKSPSEIQAVIVVEAMSLKAYMAKVDAGSGKFSIAGLPPGEYDLLVKTVGRVYEGVTLELDPEQAPTADELAAMCKGVTDTFYTSEDYFNIKRVVRLTGDGATARMLVCQTRTKHVVNPAGDTIKGYIRRIDLVEMRKTARVWQLVTGRHLLRQEVLYGAADLTKLDFTYAPTLGHILVGEKVTDLGPIDLATLPAGPTDRYATADYTAKE